MLTLGQTGSIALDTNKEALRIAAGLEAGKIINNKLVELVKPRIPVYARGYIDSPIGKAVLANAVASAMIHFLPTNQKATAAAEAMVQAGMVGFVGSFNIEEMINELLEGVTLPESFVATSEEA